MPAARRPRAAPARAQRKPTTEKESTARDDVDAKPDDDVAVKRERRAADADAVASDDESTRATKRTKSSETGTGTVGGGGDACDDDFKTLVRIDNNAGRVIGKGGENVKYIENTCGCVVEFRRDEGVAVVRPNVVGAGGARRTSEEKRASTQRAKALIEEVANTGQIMEMLTAHVPSDVNAGIRIDVSVVPESVISGDDEEEIEVAIPCPGKEGRVIGRGAATIREISARSGASCHVVKGSGVCTAKGKRKCVRIAYQMVHDTLQLQVDRFAAPSAPAVAPQMQPHALPIQGLPQGAVLLPNGMAMVPLAAMGLAAPVPTAAPATTIEVPCAGNEGRVVGKGGEMIKHLRAVTACGVDIKNNKSPHAVVAITGPLANAQLCASYVREVMEMGDTRATGGLSGAPLHAAPANTPPFIVPQQQQAYQHAPVTQYYAPAPHGAETWVRYYDAEGKPYEHNPVTNETRWV